MKKLCKLLREVLSTINFEGLRCTIKGDSSINEIMDALKCQKEIDMGKRTK